MRSICILSKISIVLNLGRTSTHAYMKPIAFYTRRLNGGYSRLHRGLNRRVMNEVGKVLKEQSYHSSNQRLITMNDAKDSNANEQIESKSPWKSYNPDTLAPGARYSLCISAVVPRPVGVLTSVNPDNGVVNCAPFSYTSLSTHDPPIVTHGICMSRGKKKDSLRNIEATGEWVFNVLEVGYLEQANDTSSPMPPDMSEVSELNLNTTPCEVIKAPRLTQARLSMECKLIHKYEVKNDAGEHTTTIVMGRVVRFHIHEDVLEKGRDEDKPLVDLCKLNPVGRAGGTTYWPVGVQNTKSDSVDSEEWTDRVTMVRPQYPIPPKNGDK